MGCGSLNGWIGIRSCVCLCVAALAGLGCAASVSPVGDARERGLSSKISSAAEAFDLQQPEGLPPQLALPLICRDGYLLLRARMGEEAVGWMMVDTGASLTVLSRGVVGRLGLPAAGQGRTVGVGGVETFDFHAVDRLAVGGGAGPADRDWPWLTLASARAAGLDLRRFGRALGLSLAGIVAYPDLSAVPFTLDAADPQPTLTLYHPRQFRPPAGATRHRLRHFRRLPVITAYLELDRRRIAVDLLVDYGADNALTLPSTLLTQYPGLASVNASGAGLTRGVGGHVESTQTWLRRVDLLGLSLEHLPVSFEPPPPGLGFATPAGVEGPARPLGRVGNALLRHFRLTFHPSHGYLYAQWQPTEEPP